MFAILPIRMTIPAMHFEIFWPAITELPLRQDRLRLPICLQIGAASQSVSVVGNLGRLISGKLKRIPKFSIFLTSVVNFVLANKLYHEVRTIACRRTDSPKPNGLSELTSVPEAGSNIKSAAKKKLKLGVGLLNLPGFIVLCRQNLTPLIFLKEDICWNAESVGSRFCTACIQGFVCIAGRITLTSCINAPAATRSMPSLRLTPVRSAAGGLSEPFNIRKVFWAIHAVFAQAFERLFAFGANACKLCAAPWTGCKSVSRIILFKFLAVVAVVFETSNDNGFHVSPRGFIFDKYITKEVILLTWIG